MSGTKRWSGRAEVCTSALVALWLSGCGSMVGELTKGAASGEAELLPAGTTVSLVYERTLDPDDPEAATVFAARVEGGEVESAAILLPDGTSVPLRVDDKTPLAAALEVAGKDDAIAAQFPNGRYTLVITPRGGTLRTVVALAAGSFPEFPRPVSPAHGAALVPTDVTIAWTGPFARYDVALVDESTGERFAVADGTEAFEARPKQPLRPGTAYRLEVTASGSSLYRIVDYRSRTIARFATGL